MRLLIDMLINDGLQCGHLLIFNRNGPHGALALGHDQYSLFVGAFASLVYNTSLRLRGAADELFIQLDNAVEHSGVGAFRVHHLTNGVPHSPSGRLSDTN